MIAASATPKARIAAMLFALAGCGLAGCSQQPSLMPDMNLPVRPTLSPADQQKAMQGLAARKAAVEALVQAESGGPGKR